MDGAASHSSYYRLPTGMVPPQGRGILRRPPMCCALQSKLSKVRSLFILIYFTGLVQTHQKHRERTEFLWPFAQVLQVSGRQDLK